MIKTKDLHAVYDKLSMLVIKHKAKLIAGAFILYLLAGLFIFADYGVHSDEFTNQNGGRRWADYVIKAIISWNAPEVAIERDGRSAPHDFTDGPFLEVCFKFLEFGLLGHDADSRDILLLRHLSIFLVFYASSICIFLICRRLFNGYSYAFVATCMLVLHPRIFSHTFYNTIDIGLLSFFIISAYTMILFIERMNFKWAVIHGASCAALIGIRSIGIIMPLITILAYSYVIFTGEKKLQARPLFLIAVLVLYFAVAVLLTIFFWPILWHDTLHNFLYSFKGIVYFDWGRPISYAYNLVWISITTPIAYLALFIIGLLTISMKRIRKEPHYIYLVIAALLVVLPIIGAIVAKTNLFDDWRHHYFIYPFMVIVAISGLRFLVGFLHTIGSLSQRRKGIMISIVWLVVALSLIASLGQIIIYHPYQSVYRNALSPMFNYRSSTDFWFVSEYSAFKRILLEDRRPSVIVSASGRNNYHLLPKTDRSRLRLQYRGELQDYIIPLGYFGDRTVDTDQYVKIFSESRYGKEVFSIYRRKDLNISIGP